MMGEPTYDIIVIGSGLGGLATATLLSKKGLKTLIVEKENRLGGRFSTIEMEGFKIPTGAIIIPDSWVMKLLKDLGIDTSYLRPVTRVFYKILGKDYEISPEMGLPSVLDIIDKLEKEEERKGKTINPVELKKILNAYLRGKRGLKRNDVITVHDWLLQFTENEKVHEVFDNLCAALMMAHSWELPVRNFFKFRDMNRFFISSKGNVHVARELASIVKLNGAVWTNSSARKILIKDGKAIGIVVLKEGKEVKVHARLVISDIGPKNTVKLAGKENFNEEYLQDLRIKHRPSPSFLVLFTSDKPLILEGINNGIEIIMGSRRIKTIVPISNVCPELAPPGKHLLYTSVEPISTIHPVEAEWEIEQIKRDLEDLFPQFKEHCRILKIKICHERNQSPEGRTWLGYGLPLETPIINLYNVGDGCVAPGFIGTTGSVESGYRAADLIEKILTRSEN